nr:DUF2235 domain-containing protein [Flammeovirga sp. SubArs3]
MPFPKLKFLERGKYEFYNCKVCSNIKVARHALAIDEKRNDFKPTFWLGNKKTDLKQVWFSGVHRNVGGQYPADEDQSIISDIPLKWMLDEVSKLPNGDALTFENHIFERLTNNPLAKLHKSRVCVYYLRKKYNRPINHGTSKTLIHESVKMRWNKDESYRPIQLKKFLEENNFNWDKFMVK